MAAHPIRFLQERTDQLFVQAPGGAEIDIFPAGGTLEPGFLESSVQRPVLPPVPLPVDQQREALFEAELSGLGILLLLSEAIRHATHPHGVQLLDRLLIEHSFSSFLAYLLELVPERRIEVIGAADVFVFHGVVSGRAILG